MQFQRTCASTGAEKFRLGGQRIYHPASHTPFHLVTKVHFYYTPRCNLKDLCNINNINNINNTQARGSVGHPIRVDIC